MQEYIISGVIITEPIHTSSRTCSLEAGTVCLVFRENKYERITLLHMDRVGDWYVEGDYAGKISSFRRLDKLSILTKDNTYPIAINEWKKIIKNNLIGESVMAELVPFKFKEGKYPQTCTECTSSFLAAKSQPFCRKCCNEMATAIIKTPEQSSINKRPRLIKASKIKEICMEAYDMLANHFLRRHEYEEWLNKKVEDASNNDPKS